MKVLAIFVAIFALAVAKECPTICPFIYEPVCGYDGDSYKLFSNKCLMDSDNCLDNHHYEVFQTPEVLACEKFNCRQACPRNFEPICGFDGEHYKVFNNLCLMESDNCLDDHHYAAVQVVDIKECEQLNCPQVCPRIYAPVCGFDGQTYQMFDNLCLMQSDNCLDHHNFHLVDESACEVPEKRGCPLVCPAIYAPVCGFDGEHYKMFDNNCMMTVDNCVDNHHYQKVDNLKACLAKTEKNCPKICPLIYAPVCGFDGFNHRVFDNRCLFDVYNCEGGHRVYDLVDSLDECIIRTDCPKVCPLIYHPVCGYDGQNYKVFDNDCYLEADNCLDNHHYSVVDMISCA